MLMVFILFKFFIISF